MSSEDVQPPQGKHQIGWSRSRAKVFRRRDANPDTMDHPGHGRSHPHDQEKHASSGAERKNRNLPTYNEHGHRVNHMGHRVTPGIQPDGESGRSWFHPWHFIKIIGLSSCTASRFTNVLWPFTIAAFILYYGFPEQELWIFITAYVGMVPAANLVGFAGQELARKLPKVFGVILETTFGSIVEIILFMVLVSTNGGHPAVIRAAILGSILANLLLCLGT